MNADYAAWYQGKSFSSDWTTHHFARWTALFASRRSSIANALEIGSWEGRSTIFWLNYFPNCQIACIDTFGGSPEHAALNQQGITGGIEARFDGNLSGYGARVEKIKARSSDALTLLGVMDRRFDFVYVDGSHRAVDVYADASLAWPMLKPGGLLLFDDYTWVQAAGEMERPKLGIDAFLRANKGSYREIHRELQILIEKVAGTA